MKRQLKKVKRYGDYYLIEYIAHYDPEPNEVAGMLVNDSILLNVIFGEQVEQLSDTIIYNLIRKSLNDRTIGMIEDNSLVKVMYSENDPKDAYVYTDVDNFCHYALLQNTQDCIFLNQKMATEIYDTLKHLDSVLYDEFSRQFKYQKIVPSPHPCSIDSKYLPKNIPENEHDHIFMVDRLTDVDYIHMLHRFANLFSLIEDDLYAFHIDIVSLEYVLDRFVVGMLADINTPNAPPNNIISSETIRQVRNSAFDYRTTRDSKLLDKLP